MFGIGDEVKVPAFVFASWCGSNIDEQVDVRVVAEGDGVVVVANEAGEMQPVPLAHCTQIGPRRRRGRRPAAPRSVVADTSAEDAVDTADEDVAASSANDATHNVVAPSAVNVTPWSFRALTDELRAEWWPSEEQLATMAATFHGDVAGFLRAIAASISLSVAEKNRILDSMPKLQKSQVDTLFEIFADEAEKFESLHAECKGTRPGICAEIESLQRKHAAEWVGIVAIRWRE